MRVWLTLLMLLCCSDSRARTAFQVRCEDSLSKAVSVLTAKSHGYSIDNSVSFRALTAMKGPHRPNSFVLGLTKTESRMAYALEGTRLADRASGFECVAPRLTVNLFYSPIVIYVGREFTPGSCAYEQILAHEMRHLNTYLDHLPKVEVTVRAALAQRFNNRPLYARTGQAQALLKQEIDTGWMPYIQKEMLKVEQLQAAIDTPKEYARLSKVCKGEVQSLIGPVKRTRR